MVDVEIRTPQSKERL